MVAVTLTAFACAKPRPVADVPATPEVGIRVGLPDGTLAELDLERYIVGTIAAEADFRGLDQTAAGRVARVQAILTRTYALANRGRHADEGFDLCSTTHCQMYDARGAVNSPVAALVAEATRATAGLVIVHDDRPINAVYHANCGGHTSDAAVPWGGDTPPYLTGVSDPFCALADPATWQFETRLAALETALATNALTRVDNLHTIEVSRYDPAGRAVIVAIDGRRRRFVSGATLRAVLAAQFGARTFASTLFTVQTSYGMVRFEGRGFGHGVGLCQRGARVRAEQGHTIEQILLHYYPGTAVRRYY